MITFYDDTQSSKVSEPLTFMLRLGLIFLFFIRFVHQTVMTLRFRILKRAKASGTSTGSIRPARIFALNFTTRRLSVHRSDKSESWTTLLLLQQRNACFAFMFATTSY